MVQRSLALAVLAVVLVGLAGSDPQSSADQSHLGGDLTTGSARLDLSVIASSDALAVAAPATPPAELAAPAAPAVAAANATQPNPEPVAAPAAEPVPVPVVPVVTVAPVTGVQAVPPPPATCPANYFCYPRLGISGPIVPYGDCDATTDVGTAIRSLTCVSPTYLAAHAYTQFGRITGWRAGDIVFAFGARYVLVDAFTQNACDFPARALAALSLQTSLTTSACGRVLVVQGRPG
ncbi:MAG TPA: hypothetical protein VGS17_05905 [Candidatus Limnocylindria bacterium]|nr:hypothetical protein [Candidatus Limnocylindria bacterium]